MSQTNGETETKGREERRRARQTKSFLSHLTPASFSRQLHTRTFAREQPCSRKLEFVAVVGFYIRLVTFFAQFLFVVNRLKSLALFLFLAGTENVI
jgi:hypothetical protein